MIRFNLIDFLPLNSKESIDAMFIYLNKHCYHLGPKEIGNMLNQIRKVKLQIYLKEKIKELNEFVENQNKINEINDRRKEELEKLIEINKRYNKPRRKNPSIPTPETYEESIEMEQKISKKKKPFYSNSNNVWGNNIKRNTKIIKIPMGGQNKQ